MGAIRVLLADDVEAFRALWRLYLALDDRFIVAGEASNGQEAVDRAEELLPDVVLLDLAMPVMDGLQAIPKLRRVSPAIRIVVLSGFKKERLARQAIELSADAYAEKGVSFQELLSSGSLRLGL